MSPQNKILSRKISRMEKMLAEVLYKDATVTKGTVPPQKRDPRKGISLSRLQENMVILKRMKTALNKPK